MSMMATAVIAAFDLICAGTQRVGSDSALPESSAFEVRFRIDLDNRRWCEGECRETRSLYGYSETNIVLENVISAGATISRSISRETGGLSVTGFMGPTILSASAQCEKAPFSGFPAREF